MSKSGLCHWKLFRLDSTWLPPCLRRTCSTDLPTGKVSLHRVSQAEWGGCRVSGSGKHHRRLSSLDGTMRRLRLSDDAASSLGSADLEAGLPRRPLTDRPASRAASARQAGPPPALPGCPLPRWHQTAASMLCRTSSKSGRTASACIARE